MAEGLKWKQSAEARRPHLLRLRCLPRCCRVRVGAWERGSVGAWERGSAMNHPFQLVPSQRSIRSIIAMVAFEKEVNRASPFSADA